MNKKTTIIKAFIRGAVAAVLTTTLLTVVADLYGPLKDLLKQLFSHHWIGKGVVAIFVFLAVGFGGWIFRREAGDESAGVARGLKILFWSTIFSAIVVFGFFVWEFLR